MSPSNLLIVIIAQNYENLGEPMHYVVRDLPHNVLDSRNFLAHSYLILTDSGGIQEEALATENQFGHA